VAEAAVVEADDQTTGQAVVAFVILRDSADETEDVAAELRRHVAKETGSIARPRQVMVVPELPKTRSGKIMRRLLRDVAEEREAGDATTLADGTGDILRYNVRRRTSLGMRAGHYMAVGEYVPNEMVNEMARERLARPDAREAFVLDVILGP
jgi:acetyl-CoA synthetase